MSYLFETFEILRTAYPDVREMARLNDPEGPFALAALRGGKLPFYFCAKNSMKGRIVSVHKRLFDEAFQKRRWIVMCVEGSYFKFWPATIAASKNYINTHNDAQMINFALGLGIKMSLPDPESSPGLFPQERPRSDLPSYLRNRIRCKRCNREMSENDYNTAHVGTCE